MPDQDLTLNQDYYVLYGGNTNTGTSQQVVGHPGGEGNPSISVSRVNPAAGTIVPPNVTAPVSECVVVIVVVVVVVAVVVVAVVVVFVAVFCCCCYHSCMISIDFR